VGRPLGDVPFASSGPLTPAPLCMAGQDPLRLMFLLCFISLLKSQLFCYCMHFYLRFVRYVLALFFIPSLTVYRCYRIFTSLFKFSMQFYVKGFYCFSTRLHNELFKLYLSLKLVFIFYEILLDILRSIVKVTVLCRPDTVIKLYATSKPHFYYASKQASLALVDRFA
jgi:hypothetical protein